MKPPRPPRKPLPGGKVARNERRKLRATSLNAIGLAIAAVGVIQPMYSAPFSADLAFRLVASGMIAYLLHERATRWLESLED